MAKTNTYKLEEHINDWVKAKLKKIKLINKTE